MSKETQIHIDTNPSLAPREMLRKSYEGSITSKDFPLSSLDDTAKVQAKRLSKDTRTGSRDERKSSKDSVKTSKDFREMPRISKLSNISFGHRKSSLKYKTVRIYQPTYRLDPKVPFHVENVERKLESIMKSELEEVEYNDKTVPEVTMNLCEMIRAAVKEMNFDRYRILVSVTIGQKRQQSFQMFHSFLWDPVRDNYANYNFENCHIFANAVVYAVYLD